MSDLSQLIQKYYTSKIAVYGLGTETERVLTEIGDRIQIVGLLDGYKESGELYGKPIISLEEAVAYQVKLILVVARPGSCKAIARRICKICTEHQIDLFDIRGKNLNDVKKTTYDFKEVEGITKNKLKNLISQVDIVSIDLFDTLIMRQTLFPTDIYEMVDIKLKEQEIVIENFCGKRLASEKYLSKSKAPTLIDIYAYMLGTCSIPTVTPEKLAELEWQTDYELVIPRQELCNFMSEVKKQGKEIYVVSDTYYTKKQLELILKKCNITFYTDIYASCEYGTGKTQHLFEKLQARIAGKKCIHIGDDITADIESAQRAGVKSCQIYSGIELFETVGYLGLCENTESLANRIKVGMFVSRLFNSPFWFETKGKKISISNAYDIGWLFFAPMITDFVIWFAKQVRKYHLENIWFCSRDGYLIKKLYDELVGNTSSTYFLTSRSATIRAGMENEEDIRYVEEMAFSGTLSEQLEERFGIYVKEEGNNRCLSDYMEKILDRAAKERAGYQSYIKGLKLKEGDIAFFDFVAKGTSQMYIGRLVENHLIGLYFLQLDEEYMREKGLDIISFYQREEKTESAIFENYYILETMLTAPMPSVKGFNEEGKPYYAEETRLENDIRCFLEAQKGISDYFKTYLGICRKVDEIDKKLDEKFLAMIHNVLILDQNFLSLTVEDPFFNRMADMTDLV